MKNYYGRALNLEYTFNPLARPSADSPSIYIFKDLPGIQVARSGTGALQTISTWIDSTLRNFTKTFTLEAIDDPEIENQKDYDTYYAAINYTLEAGEQVQTDIKEFYIHRVGGSLTHYGVDLVAVKSIYPAISSYLSDAQIDDAIRLAITEIKAEVEKQKADFDKIINKEFLFLPIAYKAIANASYSQFKEVGDRFYTRWQDFSKMYIDYMQNYIPKVDSKSSGQSDKSVYLDEAFVIREK